MSSKILMTEGSPWKSILKFAVPVLAGALLQQLYHTADTIIVGNFSGEEALSAVGTTGSFAFLLLACAVGFSAGNGVIIAQHYGAGNQKELRENASSGILLLLGMGIFFTIVGIIAARPAYTYFVAVPESILELTIDYFIFYVFGLFFQFGYNIYSSILRSVGDSAATLYFLLISSILNIGLDLLFVAVFKWGVAGAAAATDIAQAASFAAAYIYTNKKYPVFSFKLSEYTWNWKLAKQTLSIGFPIALQLTIVSLGLTLIQRAVNGFGAIMTASFTVGQRIEMYMNLPCHAFHTALAAYTGQNIGACKMDRVRSGAKQTVLLSLGMTLLVSVCVWFMSDKIVSVFGLSEQASVYCGAHLKAIAFINIILSLYIPLFGVFQGSNHAAVPTCVAVGALGVRVASTYLFRHSSFLGYEIIWWNGLFGFSVGCLISWSYYLSGRWQKNSLIAAEG